MPAPTFSNLTAATDNVDRTAYTTASISPTGNRLVFLTVHAYRNTGSAQIAQPSVSGGGMSGWDLVEDAIVDLGGADRANLWVFRALQASPGSGAVTVTFAVTLSACAWSVDQSDASVDTSGTNGSGAIVNVDFVDDSGSTVLGRTVTFAPAMTDGNTGFFALGLQATGGVTPRTDWTELADVGGSQCFVQTQYRAATDTAGSATHSLSRSGAVAVEIKAAPSSTPVTVAGAVATATVSAPSGAVSATRSVVVAGVVAVASLTAPAGTVTAVRNVAVQGTVATAGLAAPAGTVLATWSVTIDGPAATAVLDAPAGTAVGETPPSVPLAKLPSVAVTDGPLGTATVATPAGTATVTTWPGGSAIASMPDAGTAAITQPASAAVAVTPQPLTAVATTPHPPAAVDITDSEE